MAEYNTQPVLRLSQSALQLRRLETLMDVIFALVIWRLFTLLPKPSQGDWESVAAMLGANWIDVVLVAIGLLITITYWEQNNKLFGYLDGTDNRHTAIAIMQVFFLLLFLYSIVIGVYFERDPGTRLLESSAAFLVGIASFIGWRYAITRPKLVSPELQPGESQAISIRTLAEPLTAAVTIPFVFVGPLAWELAWLSYPLIRYLLRRRARAIAAV